MGENIILVKSKKFAVRIVKLRKYLKAKLLIGMIGLTLIT